MPEPAILRALHIRHPSQGSQHLLRFATPPVSDGVVRVRWINRTLCLFHHQRLQGSRVLRLMISATNTYPRYNSVTIHIRPCNVTVIVRSPLTKGTIQVTTITKCGYHVQLVRVVRHTEEHYVEDTLSIMLHKDQGGR